MRYQAALRPDDIDFILIALLKFECPQKRDTKSTKVFSAQRPS
jgi:hypothetical protein